MKPWLLLGFWLTLLHADGVQDAILQTREDIETSVRELTDFRDQVENERIPLAEEISELEKTAGSLREEMREVRATQLETEGELAELLREVGQLRKEVEFAETVVLEYRRGLEVRVHPSEAPGIQKTLKPVGPDDALLERATEWLGWGMAQIKQRFSGRVLDGQALNSVGDVVNGRYVLFGPTAFFMAEASGLAGWVETTSAHLLPGMVPFGKASTVSDLKTLLQGGGPVEIPVDVSGGGALRIRESGVSLGERLEQGGVMVIPLMLVAVSAVMMALMKCVDLIRFKVTLSSEVLQSLPANPEDHPALGRPVQSLVAAAYRHRNAPKEHMEEILHEQVLSSIPRLERSLGMLSVFGGVAPLLGLLGTVTGMIHTFQLVQLFGTGDSRTLSGGISEALVTTALGLIIAIPVLIVHAMLARKAKSKLAQLEQTAVAIVNQVVSYREA